MPTHPRFGPGFSVRQDVPAQVLVIHQPHAGSGAGPPQAERFDRRLTAVGLRRQDEHIDIAAGKPGVGAKVARRWQAQEFRRDCARRTHRRNRNRFGGLPAFWFFCCRGHKCFTTQQTTPERESLWAKERKKLHAARGHCGYGFEARSLNFSNTALIVGDGFLNSRGCKMDKRSMTFIFA